MLTSIVSAGSFQVYDIGGVSGFHYGLVNCGNVFAGAGGYHINGSENFESHAKRPYALLYSDNHAVSLHQLSLWC